MRQNTEFGIKGKHCHNCKFLEWMESEDWDIKGWICNSKNWKYNSIEEESAHLKNLEREEYRFKGKRCFEQK